MVTYPLSSVVITASRELSSICCIRSLLSRSEFSYLPNIQLNRFTSFCLYKKRYSPCLNPPSTMGRKCILSRRLLSITEYVSHKMIAWTWPSESSEGFIAGTLMTPFELVWSWDVWIDQFRHAPNIDKQSQLVACFLISMEYRRAAFNSKIIVLLR